MALLRTLLQPAARLAAWSARRQVNAFLAAHNDTAGVQQRLLDELLAAHAATDFGRRHGFGKIRSYEDFRSAVPLGSYETHRPYLQRVMEGDTIALLPPGEEVLMFSMTSGTTGQPKHIPVTRRFLAETRRTWNVWGLLCLMDHPDAWLRKILQISSSMREETTPAGKPCGAVSGLLAATQKKIVRRMYVVPTTVAEIRQPAVKYYTIFRCGAGQDVSILTTANPSSLIKLVETAQENAQQLLRDIADGTITPPGDTSAEVFRHLRFKPNPRLTRKLEEDIRRDGRLMPRHLWNLCFTNNWTGGTLRLYMPRVRELLGDLPARDLGLIASEGRFSIPMTDGTSAGVAEITATFLEFIPADQRLSPQPDLLRAHELEIGQEYFLVLTNWASLWRYNLDDRIRVVARRGQSPVFEFLSRGINTASITGEKITEHQVVEAMRRAAKGLGLDVNRFLMQGRFAAPPRYELRLELNQPQLADKLSQGMDAALAELNIEYHSKRESGRLGPIQAVLLAPGTLERMEAESIRRRRGRTEQYKHQYLLTDVLSE